MAINAYTQDSAYQMIALRGNKRLVFSEGNPIVIKYKVKDKLYFQKIRGRIKTITDSSLILVKSSPKRNVEIPLNSIYRFNKANRSILRYAGFIALGSITIALADGIIDDNYSEEISGAVYVIENIAIGSAVTAYYLITPGIIDEICRRHYTSTGWDLQIVKVKKVKKNPIFLHNY